MRAACCPAVVDEGVCYFYKFLFFYNNSAGKNHIPRAVFEIVIFSCKKLYALFPYTYAIPEGGETGVEGILCIGRVKGPVISVVLIKCNTRPEVETVI